jgi:hypothetical protein
MTKTKPKKYRTKRKKGGIGTQTEKILDMIKDYINNKFIRQTNTIQKKEINYIVKLCELLKTLVPDFTADIDNFIEKVTQIKGQNKDTKTINPILILFDNIKIKLKDTTDAIIVDIPEEPEKFSIVSAAKKLFTITPKQPNDIKTLKKLKKDFKSITSFDKKLGFIDKLNEQLELYKQVLNYVTDDTQKSAIKEIILTINNAILIAKKDLAKYDNVKVDFDRDDMQTVKLIFDTAKSQIIGIIDSIINEKTSENASLPAQSKKSVFETMGDGFKAMGDGLKKVIPKLTSKKATSLPLTDLTPDLTKDIYKMKQVSRQIDYSFTTNIEANSELLFSRLKTFIFLDIKNYITYLHNNYDNDNCKKDLNKLMFIFVAFIYLINKNISFITVNYCFFKYLLAREDNISTIVFDINLRNDLIADIISIIELMLMSDYLNLNYLYGQICINVYLYETKKNGNILSNNHIPNKIDSILHFIMRLFTNTLCYYLNNIRYYSYTETQPAYDAYKQIYTNSSSLNVNELGDFQEDRIYLNLSKNIDKKIITVLLNNLFYTKKGCRYDRIHFGGVKIEPIELANMSFDNPLYLLNHTIMDLCYLLNFYIIIQKQVFKKSLNYLTKIDTSNIQNLYDKYLEQS